MRYVTISGLTTCVVATMLLLSCQYKDFDEIVTVNKYPVTLHFVWDNVDSIPSKMRVALYPMDYSGGGAYTFYEVNNTDTTVMVPDGDYLLTAWNRDISHVITDRYDTREEIVARNVTFSNHNSNYLKQILDSLFPGHQLRDYPDYMVHANNDFVTVNEDVPNQQITVIPDSMVITINVKAHGIAGLDLVKRTRGALSNVAGTRYIAHENRVKEPVTVIFDARSNPNDSTVTASFWVFGLRPEEISEQEHHAALFFWTVRGQAFVNIDVTDIIKETYKEGSEVNIDIPDLGIDLRDLFTSGMTVEVDEWEDEIKPIGF